MEVEKGWIELDMIDEHSIPQRWKDVLKALQENGFPEAIIAGGALRDLDHGRKIKDVDIYVLDKGPDTQALLTDAVGYHVVSLVAAASEYHIGRPARPVTQVYEFEHYDRDGFCDDPPFQVIALKDTRRPNTPHLSFPRYVMEDFDLGIYRTWFDGTTWWRTPEYTQDEQDKAFRAYIPLSGRQLDLTKERVQRLSRKYPEFTSYLHYQEDQEAA